MFSKKIGWKLRKTTCYAPCNLPHLVPVCVLRCCRFRRAIRMCILFRYPDPPLLHREFPDFGLDRVFLHLVVLQFLIQCLHYEYDTSRGEFVDSCDKDGDVCLWERIFWTKWWLFHNTRGGCLRLARSGTDVVRNSGHEERSVRSCLRCRFQR